MIDVAIIAGEASGDALGARLIDAIRAIEPDARFRGVAGPAMAARGVVSRFAMDEISIVGLVPVLKALPRLLRLVRDTADWLARDPPDILVVIDAPDFNHRVARRLRAANPGVPIVGYVAPTVWAWRPGRAVRIRPFIDHLLTLFPFEPAVLSRLGGPPSTYVGHPILDSVAALRPNPVEAAARVAKPPTLLVLPGSRRGEVARHLPLFEQAIMQLHQSGESFRPVLPAVPHLADMIRQAVAHWSMRPDVVEGEEAREAAFRLATAAMAASGTVTLELAIAGVPMVGAYRVGTLEAFIMRRMITTPMVLLPNIIVGEAVVPELIQDAATPDAVAKAVAPLFREGEERRRQVDAFERIDRMMSLPGGSAAERAARVVLDVAGQSRKG